MSWLLLFGGLMAAAYATLVVVAVRRPLLARIAVREAARRPWQSVLVIAGLMIGSGAILSAQLSDDSTSDSLTAAAYQAWGRVDLTVTAPGNAFFDPTVAAEISGDSGVHASAAGVQPGIELIASTRDLERGQSDPFIRLIGFDPSSQPPFGAFRLSTGGSTFGDTLQPDQVFIGRSLATALHAGLGDRLQLSIGQAGEKVTPATSDEVRVAVIVEPQGPGSYGLRPAIYAPLATMHRLAGTNQINIIRIAAPGSGSSELDSAHALAARVRAVIAKPPNAEGLSVWEAKADDVAALPAVQGGGPADVFADLVVLAGLALVVNLVVTLVEERRPRLAVLRALGLSRPGLIAVLSMEGGLYSLFASIVGCLPGLLLGWVLYRLYATTPNGVAGQGGSNPALGRDLQLSFSLRPGAVALAIAAGAVATLATVVIAATQSSRITIAAGIRDLPEPRATSRRSWAVTGLLVGLAAISGLVFLLPAPAWRVLGGSGLLTAAAVAARGRLPDRVRMTAGGLAVVAWSLVSVAITFATMDITTVPVALSVILALVLSVFGLAVAIAGNLRLLERVTATLAGASIRPVAILRPALAYMTRRPFRAGLTIATFAMLLSLIVFYSGLLATYGVRHSRGPFDVRVFAPTQPAIVLSAAVQQEISSSLAIPTRTYLGPIKIAGRGSPGLWHQERISLYELSPEQLTPALFGIPIQYRASALTDDVTAWRALREDPGWIVWTRYGTDADVTLPGSTGLIVRRVAGDVGDPILDGFIGSRQSLAPFGNLPLGTTLLLKTRAGVDPHGVARQIQQALVGNGADVSTVQDLVDRQNTALQAFVSLPNLYMRMGLIVGILSLSILAIRAAIQRRRAIGILRALGYRRTEIMAGTLTETTLTTTSGAVIALLIGSAIAFAFIRAALGPGRPFGLDVLSLGGALALMYAAVLLATIGPAWSAARTPPAQALRLLE